MRGLRTLMLILLAAVFAVGGPLRAMPAQAAAPACHEMAETATDAIHDQAPDHKPKPDLMAVNCCVGCLPAGIREVAPDLTPGGGARIAFHHLRQGGDGLSPAPDHGPPRPLA